MNEIMFWNCTVIFLNCKVIRAWVKTCVLSTTMAVAIEIISANNLWISWISFSDTETAGIHKSWKLNEIEPIVILGRQEQATASKCPKPLCTLGVTLGSLSFCVQLDTRRKGSCAM